VNTDLERHRHPTDPEPDLDPVAVARGYLAAALDRCAADSDVALAICVAWSDLDDPGHLPDTVDPELSEDVTPLTCLEHARHALRSAIPTIEPAARCVPISASLRRLFDLITELDDTPASHTPDRP